MRQIYIGSITTEFGRRGLEQGKIFGVKYGDSDCTSFHELLTNKPYLLQMRVGTESFKEFRKIFVKFLNLHSLFESIFELLKKNFEQERV